MDRDTAREMEESQVQHDRAEALQAFKRLPLGERQRMLLNLFEEELKGKSPLEDAGDVLPF